ncbi:MAG: ATP-binding protein [bacterium]
MAAQADRGRPAGSLTTLLDQLDGTESRDVYELIYDRHQRGSMVITSNREPAEWLAMMADSMRAQSAIDRLQNAAYELVVEGERTGDGSCRRCRS